LDLRGTMKPVITMDEIMARREAEREKVKSQFKKEGNKLVRTYYAITRIKKVDADFSIPAVRNQKNYLGGTSPRYPGVEYNEFVPLCYADQYDKYADAKHRAEKFLESEHAEADEYYCKYGFPCEVTEVRVVRLYDECPITS